MKRSKISIHSMARLPVGVVLCFAITASLAGAAQFGRVSGTVTDAVGTPLMGATVLLAGSGVDGAGEIGKSVERAFTDSHGGFSIEHVVPGWYSLQVISATRLPALRTGVRVDPDETTQESFALGDVFSRIQWQAPKSRSRAWVNEWKWILRTSDSTRPILRFEKAKGVQRQASKHPLLSGTRLVAMLPGSSRSDVLANDLGMGTVVAYLHPLGENSDVLVAGSTSSGIGGSSFATVYRKGLMEKNRQEITLAVHRLNLGNDLPVSFAADRGLANSEGMFFRYAQTRQLSNALTLTAGVEIRYLNSAQNAGTAHPQVSLAYRLDPKTLLTMSYGKMDADESSTLLDRVSDLNAFPRITLRNHRPLLENATHAEARLERSLGTHSTFEIAAYHDTFRDVAVWAIGGVQNLDNLAASGNLLLKAGGSTAVLNGGRYGSSGFRAAYQRGLGYHTQMGVMYAFGDALGVGPVQGALGAKPFNVAGLSGILHSESTQSFSGKFSAHLPGVRTQVITTYTWLPAGRVTVVDPYGLGQMEFQPFLGLEIRQPLPKIDALPVRIVAMADFRNLLGQGSVALTQSNGRTTFLTPAYRTVRGGFAVQF
ncbi:MAG TPA: carboxypeptidase-like regulatory domain-containing protein [Terriglobia bacterium]|nr:carboxypeptidase-like regulatory domain-containing protein [Terriglobia bacterium]